MPGRTLVLRDRYGRSMDFAMPASTQQLLDELDEFIESTIKPMEAQDDNIRFFDHRREDARTDWDRNGLPNADWEALLRRMRVAADEAGFYRHQLPERFGGRNGSNLEMAIVREHLARKGLGLHNDLQNESSIVGNLVTVLMMEKYGSAAQQAEWIPKMLNGTARIGFGLTEPLHGSDATWMETTAVRDGDDWVITGEKYWNTGLHHATHDYIFARTSGEPGDGRGITCFITPTDAPGFKIEEFMWTFNMPTDHAHVRLTEVRVSNDDILGDEGLGLQTAQLFVHENRIRQAASSLGAGLHCIDLAVDYANQRTTFGKRLSTNQAIQFPLADLASEAEMLRALIQKTAWQLDAGIDHMEITDKVAMCNYRANRFCCNAADQAMQTCGGMGYNRAMPFEHIYRHHRRYRITEGSDEIQLRKVAGKLFGYSGRAKG
jgi:acyl-CoA dehydrogenase